MKINRYIMTLFLSLVLIVTSTGIGAFAESDEAVVHEEAQLLVEEIDADGSVETLEVVPEQEPASDAIVEETVQDAAAMAAEKNAEALQEESIEEPVTNYNAVSVMSNSAACIDSKIANNKKGYSLKDYRSILIAGVDNGGRADLIIVFSYNTKKKSAKVFTVSRDAYMQLKNGGQAYEVHGKKREFCKCNQAADFGGMEALVKELNRHLDLNIKEYIAVDWDCAAALVDELGGLDADITNESMRAGINKMLPADNQIQRTGNQTLNGWQAVQYLRVRHYYVKEGDKSEAGPRVREDRNRDVFVQLFNKAKGMKLEDVYRVYKRIGRQLDTNMDIVGALKLVAGTSIGKTPRFPYKSKTYWDPDGYYSYDVMNTNATNVATLHKNMFGQKKYKLTSTASSLDKKTKKLIKSYLKKSRPTLNNAVVTIGGNEYTGAPVTPTVSVKLGDRVLRQGNDYKLVGLEPRMEIGSYSFTVEGVVDSYSGYSKKVSYTIMPKGTSLVSLKKAKASLTANWNIQEELMPDSNITGYQVQYGLKANFSGAKTVKVAGYEKTSTTVKKLKRKKNYYVRVRTYVTDSKGTYYSAWSKALKIKTK